MEKEPELRMEKLDGPLSCSLDSLESEFVLLPRTDDGTSSRQESATAQQSGGSSCFISSRRFLFLVPGFIELFFFLLAPGLEMTPECDGTEDFEFIDTRCYFQEISEVAFSAFMIANSHRRLTRGRRL
jgi:hypothetical protein